VNTEMTIDALNRHVDPHHEARFGFCRAPCFECDRIDAIHGIDLRAQRHRMTQCIVVAMASLEAMAEEARHQVVKLDPTHYTEKERGDG
jgi:hypothetical protein